MITVNRRTTVIWTANVILFFFIIQIVRMFILKPSMDPINDGANFLIRLQQQNGSFYEGVSFVKSNSKPKRALDQAMAIYTLMQLYETSKDEKILPAVEKGLHFLSQNTKKVKNQKGGFIVLGKEKSIYPLSTAYGYAAAKLYTKATGNKIVENKMKQWRTALKSAQRRDGSYPKILNKKSTDMGNVWAVLTEIDPNTFSTELKRADNYYINRKTPSLASNKLRVLAYHLEKNKTEKYEELANKTVEDFLRNNRKNPLKNNCASLIGFVKILPYLNKHKRVLKNELAKFETHLQSFQVSNPVTVQTDHFTYKFHGEYIKNATGGFMKDFISLKTSIPATHACINFYQAYETIE